MNPDQVVEETLLTPLVAISSQPSSQTKDTTKRPLHLLDCVTSQKDVVVTYHVSNMALAVHSDAYYHASQIPEAERMTFLI